MTSRHAVRARVGVGMDSRRARRAGALALLAVVAWLVVVLDHGHASWSLTILTAVAFISRGIALGRPVTAGHAAGAGTVLLLGVAASLLAFNLFGELAIVCSGFALMRPTTARPQPAELARVWALVDATNGDPLAPFAMHSRKSHFFSADGNAMLAYRTRAGYAVVSGDPIGDSTEFAELTEQFVGMCRARGWRVLVLGCSEHRLSLWSDPAVAGLGLRAVPIGRDVVIRVGHFDTAGRRYRNLRQAVQRTHNAGVTTEVIPEAQLDDETRRELTEVLDSSHSGVRVERGFSMILDGALEGRYPGVVLIVARDRFGRVQALHRYALAGGGRDVSLDVPWRRPGAGNGVDERLSIDMIAWAEDHGARRVSLAFAAFPEIFEETRRTALAQLCYTAIHLGDRLIRLESLYRYLRKYHALGDRRYVLLPLRQLLPAAVVLLTLEFVPHHRRRWGSEDRRRGTE